MNENGQKMFEIFCQGEPEVALPAGPDGRRSEKASSSWKEDVKT